MDGLLLVLLVSLLGPNANSPDCSITSTSEPDATFQLRVQVLHDGAFVAYYVKEGPGPTLVLVPGTHSDRTRFCLPEFLNTLHPDLELVVIESRGQGRSWPPPPPSKASMEQYADDVLEVATALGLDNWYAGGHSLGGMIAIEIAGRRPPGLRGIIPMEGWPHHSVAELAFSSVQRPPGEHVQSRPEMYRAKRWTMEELDALQQIWRKWSSGVRILEETDYPVLSIWGDRGMEDRPGRDRLKLPDKEHVEVVWVEGSYHNVMAPAFAATVAQAVNDFIARVESARLQMLR